MSVRTTPWEPGTPNWADLGTSDVAASTAFYCAVLGWEVTDTGAEFGHYGMATRNGLATAGIAESMPGQPDAWTTYLATDDVDKTAEAVAAHGGTVVMAPMDVGDLGRMAIAVDPTGAGFGLWQARAMIGCALVNEPGGIVWNDHTSTDPAAAKTFYAAVFGYHYSPVEGAPGYASIDGAGPGGTVGGIGALDPTEPAGAPARWNLYFAVADTDEACAVATAHGGTVLVPPEDSPFGRMATLAGPEGARFVVGSGMLPEG